MHKLFVPATNKGWWIRCISIVLIGVLLRILYSLIILRNTPLGLDSTWYLLQGGSIRDGAGFIDPGIRFRTGELIPTAAFPPMYPMYQAFWQTLFGDGELAGKLSGVIPGSATILLTALLGRFVVNKKVGLYAALGVACWPTIIATDSSLMTEVLFVPLFLATLFCLYRAWDTSRMKNQDTSIETHEISIPTHPEPSRFVVKPIFWWISTGLCLGAATLTRQDALLLTPIAIIPVIWLRRDIHWKSSIGKKLFQTGLVFLSVTSIVLPWILRNQSRLGTTMITTYSSATALAGDNCDQSWYGSSIGSWEYACTSDENRGSMNEVAWSQTLREQAKQYVRTHLKRLPLVVAAREARVWRLWDPQDESPREAVETRNETWQLASWPLNVALFFLSLYALLIRKREGKPIWQFATPMLCVCAIAALSHGNTRFQSIALPTMLLGVAYLYDRWQVKRVQATSVYT